MSDLQKEKSALRSLIRGRIASLPESVGQDFSVQAVARLVARPEWAEACAVLGYLPLKDELELRSALECGRAGGKRVALPRYIPEGQVYCAALAGEGCALA